MKGYYFYFLALSATLLIILALALAEPIPQATGSLHPEFASMYKSANSQFSTPTVKYLAYGFGICVISIFGLSLYWGGKRNDKPGIPKLYLIAGTALYFLAYQGMVSNSWKYDQLEAPLFAGVPVATAWMLYGIWLVPIVFVLLYVYGFKKYVISPEEEEIFHKIVENRKARNQQS